MSKEVGKDGYRLAHTMIRVRDLETSFNFYCKTLGMKILRKTDYPDGRFTNAFIGYGLETESPCLELTYNWDGDDLGEGSRNFGHLAYHVDDIYEACSRLKDIGVTINRPPRDGHMAFVRSPDNVSIELLQKGLPLKPEEPWVSMENIGEW